MKFSSALALVFALLVVHVSHAIPLYYEGESDLVERGFDFEDYDLVERDFGFPTSEDLIERDQDNELEARRGGGGGLGDAVELVVTMFVNLAKAAKQDKINRGKFTGDLVAEMRKRNPKFNYVVCHTKHRKQFDGKEGVDWKHSHKEFDIKVGGTIGYEIYQFKSGWFERQGDGGWLNWAFAGSVTKNENGGKKLTFAAP